jgi:3D (Asp-Asp-Asp) domain-containing protein
MHQNALISAVLNGVGVDERRASSQARETSRPPRRRLADPSLGLHSCVPRRAACGVRPRIRGGTALDPHLHVRSSNKSRALLVGLAAVAVVSVAGCAGHIRQPSTPNSRSASPLAPVFIATAYCTGRITAAGSRVSIGTVAADPTILPIGSVINVRTSDRRYDATYHVLDTGSKVRGHRIDIFMRNCRDAVRFGRRRVAVTLVRTGD